MHCIPLRAPPKCSTDQWSVPGTPRATGFGDKDPRRFNFRRAWSSGDDDVVAGTDADNWSTAEFRAFVWGNADGRGDDIFQLIGTRDLVNEFDPDVGPHP